MLNLDRLLVNERAMKAVLGLTPSEFKKILDDFECAWDHQESERKSRRKWQRKPGGGDKPLLLQVSAKLLFILTYFKVYPTQDLQGVMFDMSQPNAHKWIHILTPVLQSALGRKMELPDRPAIRNIPELRQKYSDLHFIIDGTERPINRPSCSERQKQCYSGKKKRHTIKNTIVSDRKAKRVVFLGSTQVGSMHDKRLAEEDDFQFPPGTVLLQDTGYQGYLPDNVMSIQPKKKTRNRELSHLDKTFNRMVSMVRVRVEHTIGGIKTSRIVSDTYRNRKDGFDDLVMVVACGLHNYRITERQYNLI